MICKFKASIAGNKVFMREYEVDSGMRLYKLHEFLVSDLGFSSDQMTLFNTLSPQGKVLRRFGLFDLGDGSMDRISIDNILAAEEDTLQYIYNLGLKLSIILKFEGEAEFHPRASYPRLVAEKGHNPDQFSAVYDEYEEYAARPSAHEEEESFDEDELPEGEEEM